ncbi:MAG: hypothetical protein HY017_25030 [Betaproteobacteria bacterium]|nr:hypothetical protein [Betaproteobacteria bacterium]
MNIKDRIAKLERASMPALPNGGIIIVTASEGETEDAAKARTLAALGLRERQPGLCVVYFTEGDALL